MHLRSGNDTHLIPVAFGVHTENKQQHRPLPGSNSYSNRNRKPRRMRRRRGPAAAAVVFNQKKHKIPQTRLLCRSRNVFQQQTERRIDVIDGTVTTVTRNSSNRDCLCEFTCDDDFLDGSYLSQAQGLDDTAFPRWAAKKKRKLNNHRFHLQMTTTTTADPDDGTGRGCGYGPPSLKHSNSSELQAFAMAAAAAQSLPGTGSGSEMLFSTHSLENMVESQPQGPLLLKNAVAALAAPETPPPKNHYQRQYHRKRKFDHPYEHMYDEKEEHENGKQKLLFVDLGHPPSPGPSSYQCTCTCPSISHRHCAQEQQIPENAKIVVEITCDHATIDTASAIADEPPPPASAYIDLFGDDRPLAPVTPDKLKHGCDGDGGTIPVKSRESGFSQQHQEEEEEDMCDNGSLSLGLGPASGETEAEAEELLVDGKKPRKVKPKRKKHRARVMKEAKPNKVSVSNQEKPQRGRSSKPQAVARGRPKGKGKGKGKGKTQKKCDEEPTTTTSLPKVNNKVVDTQSMFDQALTSSIPVELEMPSDFAGNNIVERGGGFKKMRYRKLLKSINQPQFQRRAVSRKSKRLKSIARRRNYISKAMSHLLSELTKEKNNIFFNIPRKRRTPPVCALDTDTLELEAYLQQEEEADSFNLPPLPDPISFQMQMLPSNYSSVSGSGSGSGCAFEESDIPLVHQQGLTWDNYMKGGFAEQQQLVVHNPSPAAEVTPSYPSYQMVTYEGPFIEQIKSKLKKPAVLLEDKTASASYWEAERDLFKTRAEYFIKCMREAQGDRRFHPWKGSVLDSVIGVFLTQNVSDQLSSSAFISLASRFPPVGQEEDDAGIITESMDGCEGSDINIMQNFFDCSPSKPLENVSCLSTECDTEKDTKMPNNGYANNEMAVNKIQMSSNAYQIAVDNLQIVGERVESMVVNNLPMETSERMCKQFSYLALVTSDADLNTSTNLSTLSLNDCPTPSLPSNNPSSISDTSPTSKAVLYPHFPLCGSEAAFCPGLNTRTECTQFFPNTKPVSDSLSTPSFPETVTSSMTASPNQDAVQYRNSIDHANVGIQKQTINELCTNLTMGLSNKNENGRLMMAFQEGENINIKKGKKVRGKRYLNADTAVDDVDSNIKVSYSKISGIARADIEMNEGKSRHNLDWDAIGKLNVKNENRQKHRDPRFRDAVNWDAVRCADLEDIANSIKFRGMNYMLAGRIKGFLERLHEDCGSIDLEWLRTVPGHEAKNFLRSVWGLGLKSVECIRLLALHQIAFPVDTNVGRIAVRLGWVPIELPRDVQIHLVELYPSLEKVQMYLWPRLCTLDQATLYELHYQMITFGKVFCTKTKPKCHACPMQNQCKHFASACASARYALPDARSAPNYTPPPLISPMEDNLLTIAHNSILNYHPVTLDSMLQSDEYSSTQPVQNNCLHWTYQSTIEEVYEPIIEEPASPPYDHYIHDLDYIESSESADSNDIPVINLSHSPQDFCSSIGNHKQYVEDTGTLVQYNAVIPLPASTARLPVRPLKRSSRLRTEHDVYELPDSHQLLEGIEPREIDDPCPYLLAILTPEEVKESSRVAESYASSISSENFDDKQHVKGTLLIPCRTAMRGSFPLNGTYFQVNEVFADHETSLRPKDVPRSWIWHLNKRLVCFGTSITSIFRDANSDQINYCFKEGYVCVRGFDRKTRAPKPLVARLHIPPTKKDKAKQSEEMRESESKTRGRRKYSNRKQENLDLHESYDDLNYFI